MTSRQTEPDLHRDLELIWVMHVEGSAQLINVGVEYPVDEADAGAFVWVLVGQLDVDFP